MPTFAPKHFWDLTQAHTDQFILDRIGNVRVNANPPTAFIIEQALVPNALYLESANYIAATSGTLVAPGGRDWALVHAINARKRPGTAADEIGISLFSLGTGDATTGEIKCQPYYAAYVDAQGSMSSHYAQQFMPLIENNDYIFAAVKRGDAMEHYVNGFYTGRNEASKNTAGGGTPSGILQNWNNLSLQNNLRFGHSAFGDIALCRNDGTILQNNSLCNLFLDRGSYAARWAYNDGVNGSNQTENMVEITANFFGQVSEEGTDWYGMLFLVFENQAPDDFHLSLPWMLNEWKNGNKEIWPAYEEDQDVTTFRNAQAGDGLRGDTYIGATEGDGVGGWQDAHVRGNDVLAYAGQAWTIGDVDLNSTLLSPIGQLTPIAPVNGNFTSLAGNWPLQCYVLPPDMFISVVRMLILANPNNAAATEWACAIYDAFTLQRLALKVETGDDLNPTSDTAVSAIFTQGDFAGPLPERVYILTAMGDGAANRNTKWALNDNAVPVKGLAGALNLPNYAASLLQEGVIVNNQGALYSSPPFQLDPQFMAVTNGQGPCIGNVTINDWV